jgi:hypothetical protein
VFLVSSTILWFLGMFLVAIALVTIWRSRDALLAGMRERLIPEGRTPDPVEAV